MRRHSYSDEEETGTPTVKDESPSEIAAPEEQKLPTNRAYVSVFVFLIFVGGMHIGFSLGSANQLATLFNVKYGWDESQQAIYQSLIGSSVVAGLCIGAMSGSHAIKGGRRRAIILSDLMGIFGVSLTLIQNIECLLLGRVIYGAAVGIISVGMPRYLEELVPLRLYSLSIGLYALSMNLGTIFALCSAVFLPPDSDETALYNDQVVWRCIFAFPALLFTIQITGFLAYVTMDGPAFYLTKNNQDLAHESYNKIYKTEGNTSHFETVVYEFQKSRELSGSSKTTLKEAFFTNENYMRASWIGIMIVVTHELAGINVILQYSNTILDTILGEDSSGFTPRQGTYVISMINFLSSAVSVWTINTFGRRTLLLYGNYGMTIAHAFIGVSIIVGFDAGVLIGICIFLMMYQNSSGPIAYTYVTETTCDVSLGMCILALYMSILLLSLTTEPLMDSALQPQGVFFLLAFFSLVAGIMTQFMVGETMGLQKAEKKLIYVPGAAWGRKLKPGEIPHSPAPLDRRGKYAPLAHSGLNKTMESRETVKTVESTPAR